MTLFDLLLRDYHNVVSAVTEAVVTTLPMYRTVSRASIESVTGLQVQWLLRSGGLDDAERTELRSAGELLEQQGIPLDDLLRAWQIGVGALVADARRLGRRPAVGSGEIWRFTELLSTRSAAALVELTGAYRRAEAEPADVFEQGRIGFIRDVLMGALTGPELRVRAEMYGCDPDERYLAVRARLDGDGTQRQLEQLLGPATSAQSRRTLCTVVDGHLAGLLTGPPPRDVAATVGYGPPRQLERVVESYRLAARALLTAEAYRLTGAHDLDSLGLRSTVAIDADVAGLLRRRYLDPLGVTGSSEDLVDTLRAYLTCGMHVESTASRMFVHQNTVRYRLARFEELTACSLRDTEVVVELWWVLQLAAMHA